MMALQAAWIADPRGICQSLSHDRRGRDREDRRSAGRM